MDHRRSIGSSLDLPLRLYIACSQKGTSRKLCQNRKCENNVHFQLYRMQPWFLAVLLRLTDRWHICHSFERSGCHSDEVGKVGGFAC